ncbi:MAG: ABC transporter permease [Eubacteriales bacterium]|nr:ABC transporter permease [Eubacteriales bacterium]
MRSNSKKVQWQQVSTGFLSSLMAIIAGLVFGLIILVIVNPNQAIPGFLRILTGGFGNSWQGFGKVINYAVPIIMTGLSVGFAFRTGLFNIGASGQFMVGAYTAIYIGYSVKGLPAPWHWLLAFICASLAGAIWGAVPGLLKAYRNVNEVISSIMMNYIGLYLVNFLIPMTVYDKIKNQTKSVLKTARTPTLGLNKLLPKSNLDIAIFVVLLAVIVLYIITKKTTFGFELRACGLNREAARYAGINEKKSITYSMLIAGIFSGMGGALLYLSHTGTYMQVKDELLMQGFNGIPVALLGLSHPIGIFFSGLFISHITIGGNYMQAYDFPVEIIDMIIAAIIYFGAFALLFRQFFTRRLTRRASLALADEPSPATQGGGVDESKTVHVDKEDHV